MSFLEIHERHLAAIQTAEWGDVFNLSNEACRKYAVSHLWPDYRVAAHTAGRVPVGDEAPKLRLQLAEYARLEVFACRLRCDELLAAEEAEA